MQSTAYMILLTVAFDVPASPMAFEASPMAFEASSVFATVSLVTLFFFF
jgi:hypothetical protein